MSVMKYTFICIICGWCTPHGFLEKNENTHNTYFTFIDFNLIDDNTINLFVDIGSFSI